MPEGMKSGAPLSFDDVVGGKGTDGAGAATPPDAGDDMSKDKPQVKVDPKTLKILNAIDPQEIFQYLKDQNMIPKDLEMGEGNEGDTEMPPAPGAEAAPSEGPAGASAPISFGDMSK